MGIDQWLRYFYHFMRIDCWIERVITISSDYFNQSEDFLFNFGYWVDQKDSHPLKFKFEYIIISL